MDSNRFGTDVGTHESAFAECWGKGSSVKMVMHVADRDMYVSDAASNFVGGDDINRRLIIFMMSSRLWKGVAKMFNKVAICDGTFGGSEHGS